MSRCSARAMTLAYAWQAAVFVCLSCAFSFDIDPNGNDHVSCIPQRTRSRDGPVGIPSLCAAVRLLPLPRPLVPLPLLECSLSCDMLPTNGCPKRKCRRHVRRCENHLSSSRNFAISSPTSRDDLLITPATNLTTLDRRCCYATRALAIGRPQWPSRHVSRPTRRVNILTTTKMQPSSGAKSSAQY